MPLLVVPFPNQKLIKFDEVAVLKARAVDQNLEIVVKALVIARLALMINLNILHIALPLN